MSRPCQVSPNQVHLHTCMHVQPSQVYPPLVQPHHATYTQVCTSTPRTTTARTLTPHTNTRVQPHPVHPGKGHLRHVQRRPVHPTQGVTLPRSTMLRLLTPCTHTFTHTMYTYVYSHHVHCTHTFCTQILHCQPNTRLSHIKHTQIRFNQGWAPRSFTF